RSFGRPARSVLHEFRRGATADRARTALRVFDCARFARRCLFQFNGRAIRERRRGGGPLTRATDIACVFRIQLASMRREVGPFLLAALVFPAGMYLFANAVGGAEVAQEQNRLRFLAGSIIFSLSLTSISWLGYLLLENRFTGR